VRYPVSIFEALIIFLFVTPAATAQWLDKIQTESDWEFSFRDGYFDYNSYQLYRELAEGTAIPDTAEYIISSMGAEPIETAGRPIYSESHAQALMRGKAAAPTAFRMPLRVRFGRKIIEDKNTGYVLLTSSAGNIDLAFKGRDENGAWRTERRSVSYVDDDFKLKLGNFTSRIGCGMGIGRFDYRPVSYESDLSRGEEFLFPDNSYYNGFIISYRDYLDLIYSIKKYYNVRKNFAGASVSIDISDLTAGLTASGTVLSSEDVSRTLGAGSIFILKNDGELRSEIGYGESGIGFCAQALRKNYDVRFWHYDNSFINLQSSGFAHPDYESFSDDRLELSFRQPQKGETGLFLRQRFVVEDIEFTAATEVWKKSPGQAVAMDNSIQARRRAISDLLITARYADRRNRQNDRSLAELGASLQKRTEYGVFISLWIERERIDMDKSKFFLYVSMPATSRFSISGRGRWDLSADFDYFIEEKTRIDEFLSIKATYRWDDSCRGDLGPLYLIVESLW
jgi:hypothetical protein